VKEKGEERMREAADQWKVRVSGLIQMNLFLYLDSEKIFLNAHPEERQRQSESERVGRVGRLPLNITASGEGLQLTLFVRPGEGGEETASSLSDSKPLEGEEMSCGVLVGAGSCGVESEGAGVGGSMTSQMEEGEGWETRTVIEFLELGHIVTEGGGGTGVVNLLSQESGQISLTSSTSYIADSLSSDKELTVVWKRPLWERELTKRLHPLAFIDLQSTVREADSQGEDRPSVGKKQHHSIALR
jgi:hypothetical protein